MTKEELPSILMVADDADQREMFAFALRAKGFRVDDVEDAESGLARLDSRAYAVVITDYELPRMNAPEFVAILRERWPKTAIVLMTTHVDGEQRARALGVDAFFDKMAIFALPTIIRDALARHGAK